MRAKRKADASIQTTIFQWGYWGWGGATSQLVQAFDAVEATRGFGAPLFVDVRYRRSVRAVGFREGAFEKTVGAARYRWMKKLGNERIATGEGPDIQIVDPAAAGELFELAVECAAVKQRVIFFCACEFPIRDDGSLGCHRVEVARLVQAHARRVGSSVALVEWPGGEPTNFELEVPEKLLPEIAAGRQSIPLPEPVDIAFYAGLAWGSRASLRTEKHRLNVLTGPARFSGGRWQLPLGQRLDEKAQFNEARAAKAAAQFRKQLGYETRQS